MIEKVYVIYHNDPDGWACGWLTKNYLRKHKTCMKYNIANPAKVCFLPVDYGTNLFDNKDMFKNVLVFMLDFSIQPYNKFKEFAQVPEYLVWIDHHKTAIEEYKKDPFSAETYLKEGIGACASVYEYFYKNQKLPLWLELIANYDVWRFPYLNHHHYLIAYMKHYEKEFSQLSDREWRKLEQIKEMQDFYYHTYLKVGKYFFENWLKEKINIIDSIGFEKELWGHKCICVNGKGFNSLPFERHPKYRNYDIWVTFFYLGNDKWTVSLYSEKVNVGEIAKKYGGGGHAEAAGFQCSTIDLRNIIL